MAVNEEALMWVEKYRPKNLNEVVDLHDIVESLKAFMRNPKTMPHLMFAGIPGTGKTTLALALRMNFLVQTGKASRLSLMLLMKEASILCVKELRIFHVTAVQVLAMCRLR